MIYETDGGRPFWKLRPLQVAVTLLMVLLLALVALALVLTGPIVDAVAEPLGIGDTAVTIWNIAKWPVLRRRGDADVRGALLRHAEREAARLQVDHPGAACSRSSSGSLASVAFALYVSKFGSYDKTYGTLGGLVALLVWIWISNIALLLGAELNAERERDVSSRRGCPAPRSRSSSSAVRNPTGLGQPRRTT